MPRKSRIDFKTFGFVFPPRNVPLYAMISSCGVQRVSSARYDWDGLKRGDAEFSLFQYTISGHGRLDYEGRQMEVGPGTAMLLHFPHRNRYWWQAGSPKWDFVYVTLHGREVRRLWMHAEAAHGPLVTLPRSSASVRLAFRITQMAVAGKIQSEFEGSKMAYDFMMNLCSELMGRGTPTPKLHPFESVRTFCRQHSGEPIGVEDMARMAGLSRFYFSRAFKTAFGVSPGVYLFEIRMRKAIQLLRDSRMPVKAVAAECGFSDFNYFCRAFRRFTGVPARQFRHSGMY